MAKRARKFSTFFRLRIAKISTNRYRLVTLLPLVLFRSDGKAINGSRQGIINGNEEEGSSKAKFRDGEQGKVVEETARLHY